MNDEGVDTSDWVDISLGKQANVPPWGSVVVMPRWLVSLTEINAWNAISLVTTCVPIRSVPQIMLQVSDICERGISSSREETKFYPLLSVNFASKGKRAWQVNMWRRQRRFC